MSETTRARSPVAPGDIVGGKYRVERVLGAGGMGVVVAARHVELDQPVALKFILPEAVSGESNLKRFQREAQATVKLRSEHVARVYDVGRDADERPYIVLELLEGMDLAKLNQQRGPLPVADSVEYVLQACEGLMEAHALGIIHRDLKPQNLFVTRRLNGMPLVKVLDFGIAKAIGPTALPQMALTDSATIIGSPLYMAPEQMRAEKTIDAGADIWSIGVVLYELLGGELPFTGDTVTAVVIKVVNEPPKPLTTLRPGLDPALATIVMKCLEKSPEKRWANVAQLASALEPFSRSAKQGGLVRPWRSFEDTADSAVKPAGVGLAAAAAAASSADATGPATAVTFPDTVQEAMPPSTTGPRPPEKLASTDVTWGQANTQPPPPRRARSGGIIAGVLVAAAAAAGVAFVVTKKDHGPTVVPAATATPPATETVAPQPPPPATTALPAATAPSATPVIAVSALPATAPRKSPARPARAVEPAPAVSTAKPVAAPPPATAEPVSPNGAPILR